MKQSKGRDGHLSSLKAKVLAGPESPVLDYVDIIDYHPQYTALIGLELEPQVMLLTIFESVGID